jgi:hypothetical protein
MMAWVNVLNLMPHRHKGNASHKGNERIQVLLRKGTHLSCYMTSIKPLGNDKQYTTLMAQQL